MAERPALNVFRVRSVKVIHDTTHGFTFIVFDQPDGEITFFLDEHEAQELLSFFVDRLS